VRVMLRCRPLSSGEVADGRSMVVAVSEPLKRVTLQATRPGDAEVWVLVSAAEGER
jgi:hypothetical protein